MSEKKFNLIVVGVSAVAILLVILLSIPWGGDKKAIMREYDSLDSKDHVYVSITYDELIKRIDKGESFQVYIGSPETQDANQFVYEANKLAKRFGIETIYYLRLQKLSDKELTKIKIESDTDITFPTLIYWEGSSTERSISYHISSLKSFDDYGNWVTLLTEYFEQCFEE